MAALPDEMRGSPAGLFGKPELLRRVTILEYAAPAAAAPEPGLDASAYAGVRHAADPEGWPPDAVAPESDEAGWRPWLDLILHSAPRPVVADLARRGISIPKLNDAHGDINLDYYSVRISKLPFLHGRQMTAEALLVHIRRNINDFLDTNNSSFPPLDNSLDKPRWESDNPLGAVIDINVNVLRFLAPRRLYIDHSLVVCSRAEPRLWVFTTAHSQSAGYHPVTGNRMWGIQPDGNEWVLFTRGADRATQLLDWVENVIGSVWAGADALWRSFQARVRDFINANYGSAVVVKPESSRWPWAAIRSQLPSAPAEEFSPRPEGLPGRQGPYLLPGAPEGAAEEDVQEEDDFAEAAEGPQAVLEWENLATVSGFDGKPHVYYLDSGPPGGGASTFQLRVRNTNPDRRFEEPYSRVRFRHRRNGVDVPVPWGEQAKTAEAGNWKRDRSEEVAAGASHLIPITMSPATRRSAYDPEDPQTWIDVRYRWREGSTHYGRNRSLPFYLVAGANLMFTQGRKLKANVPLNNPSIHQRFWILLFQKTFGPSDKEPIEVSFTVSMNVASTSSGSATLSGTVSGTTSETEKVGTEKEIKSEFSLGIDDLIKLGAGSSAKTSTGFEWTHSNTTSYTQAFTRSSAFEQGIGRQKSFSTKIAAPPGHGVQVRTLYLYPIVDHYVLPVIEYRKPNNFGQATERVVVPDVPVTVPVDWGVIEDPLK